MSQTSTLLIEGGQVVEQRIQADFAGMQRQLGVLPC